MENLFYISVSEYKFPVYFYLEHTVFKILPIYKKEKWKE